MISKMWAFPTELKVGPRGKPGAPVHGKDGVDGVTPPGVIPRGKWSPKIAYEVGDLVRSGGSAWLAISDNRNRKPAAKGPWFLIVTDGKKGEPGASGGRGRRAPVGVSASIVDDIPFWDVVGVGQPVYVYSDGTVRLADSSSIATANVIGLATSSSAFETSGIVQRNDWSSIVGVASLVPNTIYFLSTAGTMSTTAPSSGVIVQLGKAISFNKFLVEIQQPVIL